MKNCYKCNKIKSAEEFHKSKSRYDGLNSLCKECSKKKSKPRRTPQSPEYKRAKTLKKRLTLIMNLGGKCIRCSNDDYRVLEFDHVDPIKQVKRLSACYEKDPDISNLQLLCANCHRIKTYYPEEFSPEGGIYGQKLV